VSLESWDSGTGPLKAGDPGVLSGAMVWDPSGSGRGSLQGGCPDLLTASVATSLVEILVLKYVFA